MPLREWNNNSSKLKDKISKDYPGDGNSKIVNVQIRVAEINQMQEKYNSFGQHMLTFNHIPVLTDESIVAQSVLFLLAAFDTTASALAFASFLLAKYPVQQQRLRQELQQMVQEHGDVTYQGIMEATFLDACIMESLRLYPPAVFGSRVCNKTYKIPGTKVVLRPGDLVTIPFWSLHHDPRYWPEPEVFLPDRFLPENKTNITSFTHMPFGMGPRNCIGMRFALMKVKVALAKLLLKAEIHLRSGHEEPKLERSPFLLRPGGLHLVISPLTAKTNKQ
ncbi:cytochrome P450 9e2-like [Cherax quadricarinatus]|uniref:cytochrome P450 9e2-like n=1 Tax=Cherax quadricarinatus TaxID=27406 RepID=UPI00387ECAD1